MSAKRVPNKPLLKINGKSIISLVYSNAVACKIGRVIVATADKKISHEIKKYNGNVILTSKKHQSGTDRIWEAFKKLKEAMAITGMDIQDFVNSEPYRSELHLKRMNQDLNSIK